MITTVTLNASIDKMYRLKCAFETGTVMRVEEVSNSAGGKGLNVSRAIATCGEEVCATGFVGGNNGRMLCELAEADGIPCDFVQVKGETRCCINAIDKDLVSTELLEPGCPVEPENLSELTAKLAELAAKSDVVTISGSAPKGLPADVYCTLVGIAKKAGARVILDTSGALLTESLPAAPTMIKPNSDEIKAILGSRPRDVDEVVGAAREIRERYGIEQVVVSLGSKGAVMSCGDCDWQVVPAKIKALNPVGSGDTMVGAFAVAMAQGMKPAEQLVFASACASANCLTQRTGRFEMAEAERLREQARLIRL